MEFSLIRPWRVVVILFLSSAQATGAWAEEAPSVAMKRKSKPPSLDLGIDESIIDPAIKPCDDFYQYACGKWLEKTQIPSDESMWDRSFVEIRDKNRMVLKQILEEASEGETEDSENPYLGKLGDFYAACMDDKSAEANSLGELQEEMKVVEEMGSSEFSEKFAAIIAKLHLKGVHAFFDFGEQQDYKDATQVIGVVDQDGMSLPDRDYYILDDAKTLKIRNLFNKHIQNILILLGSTEKKAREEAPKILKLETRLAKSALSRTDRRNPYNVYHRLDRKGLQEKAPKFNWNQYFKEVGTENLEAINVAVPDFFAEFNNVLDLPEADLRLYLKWHWVRAAVPALSEKFVTETFRFVSEALSGQKELEPRWKRCVRSADRQMGFALGRSYVERRYGKEGKEITKKMIQAIEKAFREELNELDWMKGPTRVEALKKLSTIVNKVGYPDTWRNYDALLVDRKSFLKSWFHSWEFNSKYHLGKIGKPLDRNDWEIPPQTVNAYYDASLNEMVFPAGILQPPFFGENTSMPANFGAIGMVMGHELTHGFDDQGRHYDFSGNLKEWWSPDVAKGFEERTQCVVKEYDEFQILSGLPLNGKLTLGENIADHGGVRLAYRAWKRFKVEEQKSAVKTKIRMKEPKSRFSEDKRFFLAFAQAWCNKKQEQIVRMLVKTDTHAPGKFRVNGTLSQFSKFSEVFHCERDDRMLPEKRCRVW